MAMMKRGEMVSMAGGGWRFFIFSSYLDEKKRKENFFWMRSWYQER